MEVGDGGLARYGKGSTELSRGKVEICGRCVWLQRAMMNWSLVKFVTLFCFDQEPTVCFFLQGGDESNPHDRVKRLPSSTFRVRQFALRVSLGSSTIQ